MMKICSDRIAGSQHADGSRVFGASESSVLLQKLGVGCFEVLVLLSEVVYVVQLK